MFFRKKKRIENLETALADAKASVEGSLPEVVEAGETVVPEGAVEETTTSATVGEGERAVATTESVVRLFPGFERDDFEVGFRPDSANPSLMMRWKDGGEWFNVPAIFNRGVLAAMDERDSAGDLNRLLRNYGYDVGAASE